VKWSGHFPAGATLNGIVSHEDWLPTFAAAAGDTNVKERLLKETTINGRKYRNHIDGYNQLDYLSGKVKVSPRKEFWYVNDDGQVVAARYDDWKVVFMENRGQAFGVWREPFVELRIPLLFNLRRDPFEKAQHNANVYEDWFLDHPFVIVPIQTHAAKFLISMNEYPPSQSPGAFNLSKIEEMLKNSGGSH
jgi:arylsulfatase